MGVPPNHPNLGFSIINQPFWGAPIHVWVCHVWGDKHPWLTTCWRAVNTMASWVIHGGSSHVVDSLGEIASHQWFIKSMTKLTPYQPLNGMSRSPGRNFWPADPTINFQSSWNIWAYDSDLIVTSLQSWLVREIIPKMALLQWSILIYPWNMMKRCSNSYPTVLFLISP